MGAAAFIADPGRPAPMPRNTISIVISPSLNLSLPLRPSACSCHRHSRSRCCCCCHCPPPCPATQMERRAVRGRCRGGIQLSQLLGKDRDTLCQLLLLPPKQFHNTGFFWSHTAFSLSLSQRQKRQVGTTSDCLRCLSLSNLFRSLPCLWQKLR